MVDFMTPPPFGKIKKGESEMTENTTTTVEETEMEEKKRTRSTTPITKEAIVFVREHVKSMSITEMAEHLGLTKPQVNRILTVLKGGIDKEGNPFGLRGHVIKTDGEGAYAKTEDGKYDWNQPLTDLAKKVEEKIANELSRRSSGGSAGPKKKGGTKAATQAAINEELESLLAEL